MFSRFSITYCFRGFREYKTTFFFYFNGLFDVRSYDKVLKYCASLKTRYFIHSLQIFTCQLPPISWHPYNITNSNFYLLSKGLRLNSLCGRRGFKIIATSVFVDRYYLPTLKILGRYLLTACKI